MEFNHFDLPNGIRVIHKPTVNGEVAHCGLMINAGSRDELPHEHGLAHYIEHCLFKGTEHRKAFHVLNRLDSVGGELNAYTTKEETAIYASFLKGHLDRAMEIITDITFHSTFPEKELKKEKDVIIDEIQSYQDSPAELIFDDFEELVFKGHALGKTTLGTEESVKNLSRKNILEFIDRQYCTDQMVFSVYGNISEKKLRSLCEKYLEVIPAKYFSGKRNSILEYDPVHKTIDKDTHQVHLTLGSRAYSTQNDKKTGLILLTNILGGPAMNSRLSMNIREKYGIAYNIEASYQAYSDTGIFEIYLGTDKSMFKRSRDLILKEVRQLREKKLGPAQLHQAKQQLKGQIALAQDSGANMMLALAKSLLNYDKVDTTKTLFEKIDSISAEELLEIANEIMDESNLSSLAYL